MILVESIDMLENHAGLYGLTVDFYKVFPSQRARRKLPSHSMGLLNIQVPHEKILA